MVARLKHMVKHRDKKVVIIGAGPAGLTAAYELCKSGVQSIVLEKDNIVGGISRTVNYKGYHFDIGGHRFFTKVKAVDDMWREVLSDGEFLRRKRLSRIYFNKKFFYYPLRSSNALFGLGFWNSFLILLSYLWAQIVPQKPEETFEQWVSNRFGKRLYRIFFKTYTEKVWGIPANEITAEWAAQRIKGLSLLTALKKALINQKTKNGYVIKTLIDEFHYPKCGPGMMWEKVVPKVEEKGSKVCLGAEVERFYWANNKLEAVEININGHRELIHGTDFISSMPIRELIQKIQPSVPSDVLLAAKSLNYRDFITVVLIINKRDVFPDNWIYIHDPDVMVGRIQNFKNWSPHMVPDPNKTCLGLEYFCFEGDGLWTMSDQELIDLGKKEVGILDLAHTPDIIDGTIVKMPKAYPVYDSTYAKSLQIIRKFLNRIDNLQLVGRNGMHKYNNQDHSMLTAMLAVQNILGKNHDLWAVNTDQEYHEEISQQDEKVSDEISLLAATQPRVPSRSRVAEHAISDNVLIKAFSRVDKLACATSVGSICSLTIFLATLGLIVKGGDVVGQNLQLLSQYFIGYTVTVKGAFIGMGYGFLWGFIWGWLFAYLHNVFIGFYIYVTKKKSEALSLRDFLDHF
jgi:protoporphyrinogen oxidase